MNENSFETVHRAVSAFEKICETIVAVRKLTDEEFQMLVAMMERYVEEGKRK